MQRSEYWLLDSVIVAPYPVSVLALAPEEIQGLFRGSFHGMDRDHLTQTILNLWHAGYLTLFDSADIRERTRWLLQPDPALLHAAFMDERDLYYAVTDYGASIWEELSHPQWHKFTQTSTINIGVETIDGGSKQIVEELVSLFQCMHRDVVMETIEWTHIQPWMATYWKTLPEGYRVRYHRQEIGQKAPFDSEAFQCYQRWGDVTKWYSNPFVTSLP